MIIDCHVHLNDYSNGQPEPLPVRIGRLEEAMHRNCVDFALVLSSYRQNAARPSTAELVAALDGKARLGVVAGFSMDDSLPSQLTEVRELLRADRIYGLKLYPGYEEFYPHDVRTRPIYELAAEFGVPVMLHSGDTFARNAKIKYAHPLQIDEVAVDHPTVNFVVCHLGNPWFRDCMEVVYKNRNVYADLSGLVLGNFTSRFQSYLKRQLDEFLLFAGEPSWLLFGTDWPLCSVDAYVDFMKRTRMAGRDRDRILWENAARLFAITVPGAPEIPIDPPRGGDPPRRRRPRPDAPSSSNRGNPSP